MVVNHRETVSGITHFIAAIFAFMGLLWLLFITRDNLSQMLVMLLYGISQIAVFAASARLHLSNGSHEKMHKLRRQDHASIYFVIGGTYTPLVVLLIDGMWQWVVLAMIWGICIFGIYWKLYVFKRDENVWVSTAIYVLVGWFAVFCSPLWLPHIDLNTLGLIAAGGIIYSIGAVIFVLERPNLGRHFGFHELWHILVMIASLLHFLAIVRLVTLGG